ncbi:S8 family serine peptidase [Muricoccus aerilatus]|uniref:S8 family serine peptidase n=1 Tax=Muricoccus aerilatus TaxID=452982 RepID=UPI0012EC1467|nr:S8 family serine peptidase [Roseomonas aerilata]
MLLIPNEEPAREAYRAAIGPEGRTEGLTRRLGLTGIRFAYRALPSLRRTFRPEDRDLHFEEEALRRSEEQLPALVLSLKVADVEALTRINAAAELVGARIGLDLPVAAFEGWCPGHDGPAFFKTRSAASALIGAWALEGHAPPLLGAGVNLVTVDLGFNAAALAAFEPAVNVAGAWEVKQGLPPMWAGQGKPVHFGSHGTMVARNVLSLAPAARLFDFPLLPDRLAGVVGWTSWAAAALLQMQADITVLLGPRFPGPWVLCNAWGVYDRRQESVPANDPMNYTGNPRHPLNQLVADLDDAGHDQVFAAGNGGHQCPHPLCGPGDTGPGNSIFGANSHARVLTAGAVRADGMWLGYSSEGPGQPGFREPPAPFSEKPDLCAPSQFAEDADAYLLSSGTSAACGLAAGALAALRGDGSPHAGLSTSGLRAHLRGTARKPPWAAAGYDLRCGWGILDLAAAVHGPGIAAGAGPEVVTAGGCWSGPERLSGA